MDKLLIFCIALICNTVYCHYIWVLKSITSNYYCATKHLYHNYQSHRVPHVCTTCMNTIISRHSALWRDTIVFMLIVFMSKRCSVSTSPSSCSLLTVAAARERRDESRSWAGRRFSRSGTLWCQTGFRQSAEARCPETAPRAFCRAQISGHEDAVPSNLQCLRFFLITTVSSLHILLTRN